MTATVEVVAPLPKRPISEDDQARIRAALDAKRAADDELLAAVLDAASNGASVRELAAFTGMSTNTVSNWKRDSGRFRS